LEKKRESTATSPFGLHIGHYKIACDDDEILEIHRKLLLLPFIHCFVPDRWTSTVQCMLEKDPGRPWIHRLRIIELFDAQVNAGFQIFIGRRMMYRALDSNLLHPSSYSSTPGKTCQEASLHKVLMMDMMRLCKMVGGIFDCDATGCFDRMIPAFIPSHTRRLGLPKSVSCFVAQLMWKCKLFVKTKSGVTKESIRSKIGNVLFGIGQGNGGGPAMWIAHLIVIFSVLQTLVTGMVLSNPSMEKVETAGVGYVDDVTLGRSIVPQNNPVKEAAEAIRETGQTWEEELYTTGGKLELSKCFWVLFAWKWRGGRATMVTPIEAKQKVVIIQSESGVPVTIPQKAPIKPRKDWE